MSKIYFKCPNCGRVREVKANCNRGFKAECFCKRKDGTSYIESFCFDIENIQDLLVLFAHLNILWGYDDKINWIFDAEKRFTPRGTVLFKKDFVFYSIVSFSSELGSLYRAIPSCGCVGMDITNSVFFSEKEAKRACEEDFQRRKAGNE